MSDAPEPPEAAQRAEAAQQLEAADCCAPESRIGQHFNRRLAEQTVDGQLPEMVDVSRMLFELLADDVAGSAPRVLELGSGSGALSVELLVRGAQHVDGIDLSPDAVAAAGRRAAESGVVERASFKVGDGARVEHGPHDWVVMDRVICCYPDPDRLLAAAVAAARTRIAFSVPIWRGWKGWINRLGWALENIPARLFGRACPTFVHDVSRLELGLAKAGFRRSASATLGLWYAATWDRVPGGPSPEVERPYRPGRRHGVAVVAPTRHLCRWVDLMPPTTATRAADIARGRQTTLGRPLTMPESARKPA